MRPIPESAFVKSMRKIREREELDECKARDKPRLDFLAAAKKVKLSKAQALLMWDWFALKDHEHWNGKVG